jgi:hypothetical protein
MKKLFVVLMAVALVGAFTVPAAAEWNWYGSARVETIYENPTNALTTAQLGATAGDDQLTSDVNIQNNSRIGAKVKAGNIGGRWEFRFSPNEVLLFGTWNFGRGTLLVGQDYTPLSIFFSKRIYKEESPMFANGAMYAGRLGQIKVMIGGFQIALIDNNGTTNGLPNNLVAPAKAGTATHEYTDVDVTFPKLEARYNARTGAFTYQIGAGVQTYSVSNTGTTASQDIDVTGWCINAGIAYTPGRWYAKWAAYYGVNMGSMGYAGGGNVTAKASLDDIYDNKAWGTHILGGFVINKMFTVEAGYGYTTNEADQPGAGDNPTQAYYIQTIITLAKGVYIVPEIGVVDLMTTAGGADEGSVIYYGAKTQIDF